MASKKTEEKIRELAYKYYVEGGRRENNALADWTKAEKWVRCKECFKNTLFALIVASIAGVLCWGAERFGTPFYWILVIIVFCVVTASFSRPWNIQPVVFISFITLLFVGASTLWQKENFELRNRPYIQIVDKNFKIRLTNVFRLNNSEAEPGFVFTWYFVNHGPVPASVKDIVIKGFKNFEKIPSAEGIPIGAFAQDKESQWKTIDVFPPVANVPNLFPYETFFYFNTGDIQRLFGFQWDAKEILKDRTPVLSTPGLFGSPYLLTKKGEIFNDFYIAIQFKYYALGEARVSNKPYYYWVIYQCKNGIFSPFQSGAGERFKRD